VNTRWSETALEPPRALGEPLARGILRREPEDFVVEEELGFLSAGAGQHVLLKVRKRDANTQWIARELAKVCGCRPNDVGYAGLKDRRAVSIQWFSVPQSRLAPAAWPAVKGPDFEVLEAHVHSRKLPRGALAGNRFTIRVREVDVDEPRLAARMAEIGRRGVPNYFGPQRFGRGGSNLARIGEELRALRPQERGFVLSAARSLVFNAVLAERVREGRWDRLEAGDIANLDGRGSVFPVAMPDQTLVERCERLDIHPTGALWGRGVPATRGPVLELETRIAAEFPEAGALTAEAGMAQERRSLRVAVREQSWECEPAAVVIRFRLTRGSFATAVLREVFEFEAPELEDD
jgi:tRNA pseudouridine13 synthase